MAARITDRSQSVILGAMEYLFVCPYCCQRISMVLKNSEELTPGMSVAGNRTMRSWQVLQAVAVIETPFATFGALPGSNY